MITPWNAIRSLCHHIRLASFEARFAAASPGVAPGMILTLGLSGRHRESSDLGMGVALSNLRGSAQYPAPSRPNLLLRAIMRPIPPGRRGRQSHCCGHQAWHRRLQDFIAIVHHPLYPELLVHCLNITARVTTGCRVFQPEWSQPDQRPVRGLSATQNQVITRQFLDRFRKT